VLARLDSALVERFAARQVMYLRNYGNGLGLFWQQTFQTTDPRSVEDYCRQRAIEIEWRDDGRLRTRQVRPAIRRHPQTNEPVWFNHAAFFHPSTLDARTRAALEAGLSTDELPFNTLYGDGTPLETETLAQIRRAYREETVAFSWQRHDILLLDNMLVAHGRESYDGPRKIAAALGDPIGFD
jgi:alpha-ketoglutarate-dependent taurine dioxygenase